MSNEQQWKPGDVANGHVLTEHGQWVPLPAPTQLGPASAPATGFASAPSSPLASYDPPKKRKKWPWAVGGVAALAVLIGAVSSGEDPAPASASDKPAASEPARPDTAKNADVRADEKADEAVDAAPSDEPVEKPAADVLKVTAKQILNDYDNNEAAADAKYDGKTLQVTGVVDKVDTEFWDEEQYVIQLGTGSRWELLTVNFNDVSADVAAHVKTGATLTLEGKFDDGGDLGVEVADSKVVSGP